VSRKTGHQHTPISSDNGCQPDDKSIADARRRQLTLLNQQRHRTAVMHYVSGKCKLGRTDHFDHVGLETHTQILVGWDRDHYPAAALGHSRPQVSTDVLHGDDPIANIEAGRFIEPHVYCHCHPALVDPVVVPAAGQRCTAGITVSARHQVKLTAIGSASTPSTRTSCIPFTQRAREPLPRWMNLFADWLIPSTTSATPARQE